jgi:hypothetical protein
MFLNGQKLTIEIGDGATPTEAFTELEQLTGTFNFPYVENLMADSSPYGQNVHYSVPTGSVRIPEFTADVAWDEGLTTHGRIATVHGSRADLNIKLVKYKSVTGAEKYVKLPLTVTVRSIQPKPGKTTHQMATITLTPKGTFGTPEVET